MTTKDKCAKLIISCEKRIGQIWNNIQSYPDSLKYDKKLLSLMNKLADKVEEINHKHGV